MPKQRKARRPLVVLWVAAAMLVLVAAAQAENSIVPNFSFAANCSGIPCQWSTIGNGGSVTLVRDTTNDVDNDGASLKATITTSAGNFAGAISDCFTGFSPGQKATAWFESFSADPNVSGLFYTPNYYTTTDCSGLPVATSGPQAVPPSADDWNISTVVQLTVPANRHSARVVLAINCIVCSVPATANFDEVIFDPQPLAVTVASSSAHRVRGGVVVRWRTGTEADELGFNVFRQQGTRLIRLDKRLLPAVGGLTGSSYSFLDRHAPRKAVRYWLQDVDVRGKRTWHGPLPVAAS